MARRSSTSMAIEGWTTGASLSLRWDDQAGTVLNTHPTTGTPARSARVVALLAERAAAAECQHRGVVNGQDRDGRDRRVPVLSVSTSKLAMHHALSSDHAG